MISGKNHITRQKNIEVIGSNEDSSNNINTNGSTNLSECGSLASNNSNANSNEELTNKYHSSQESSSSTNVSDKLTPDFLSIPSNNHLMINPIIKTGKSSGTSSRHQISAALRERILRSKSPRPSNNHKPLITTLSNPAVTNKLTRSANLGDVSGDSGSFFSRSCPGEDLTESAHDDTLLSEKISKMNVNMKTNSFKEETTSSHNLKSIGKSLLAFATLKHSKNKKFIDSNGSLTNNSNWSSINNEPDEANDSEASLSSAISNSSNSKKTHTKIGLYDVDLEKIARELSKPSVDTPLTSFSLSPNPKPVLQTSKTIDEESSTNTNNKKTLMRSYTQNK